MPDPLPVARVTAPDVTTQVVPALVAPNPDVSPTEPSAIAQRAWASLERGARDRRAGFHTLMLSTFGLEGYPEARTVVLRYASGQNRVVRFHTDARSTKFREMQQTPQVTLLGYDPPSKLQVRLRGVATLHQQDEVARAAWRASQPQSLMCYRQPEPPSSKVNSPPSAPDLRGVTFAPEDGLENFTVVSVSVQSLEWLYLSRLGHQRIRFDYGLHHDQATANVAFISHWLAP